METRLGRFTCSQLLAATAAVGVIAGMLTMLVAFPPGSGTIICPPRFTEATRVDITASYDGMPPEMTDIDREFAEACGLEWGEPYFEEPPESGA